MPTREKRLKELAMLYAAAHNHTFKRKWLQGDPPGAYFSKVCQKCGRMVTANLKPKSDRMEIFGSAIEIPCSKKDN